MLIKQKQLYIMTLKCIDLVSSSACSFISKKSLSSFTTTRVLFENALPVPNAVPDRPTWTKDVLHTLNSKRRRCVECKLVSLKEIFQVSRCRYFLRYYFLTSLDICSVLAISYLGADHHFRVKTRFRILVESSFI